MDYLYNVMTTKNKNVLMNIRVRDDVRKEFQVACELKGAKASHLIHQFMVKTIREEKDRDPAAFEQALSEYVPPEPKIKAKKESNVVPFQQSTYHDYQEGSTHFKDDDSVIVNVGTDPPDGQPDPFLDEYIEKHLKGKPDDDE